VQCDRLRMEYGSESALRVGGLCAMLNAVVVLWVAVVWGNLSRGFWGVETGG
jgi:hypothetical protein